MQPLPPGDLSQLELVGSGGFGEVYRGRSARLGTDIALKKTLRDSEDDLKSLLKEKDMMSRANYTYVLRLLGLYDIKGRKICKFGLVMEYMPYGSLCTLFKLIENVPWALKFQILHQVALGMNYLHHVLEPPIIHRDLKPHNVLLNKSLDIQLTDFGLAKNVESDTSSQYMAGTVSYMPPEALKSITYKPTKEFDVYSFAILTWSVLSAKEPYKGVDREIIQYLIPQGQTHRPDMNLVNQWTSQKRVPEAIQLMQECWDADPSKRPLFSAIIKRTDEMNAAYAGEIHNEIIKVLDELKKHNSAHSQALDNPDGGKPSNPGPSIPDTYSLSVNDFRNILQLAEKREAHAHNRSVSPEFSKEENVDAKVDSGNGDTALPSNHRIRNPALTDFLESNFPQIVQAKPDLSEVLDVLFSKRTITQEELDTIKLGSIQDQIRKTLRTIISKGQESCMEFLQLLNRHSAELMTSLTSNSLPGGK